MGQRECRLALRSDAGWEVSEEMSASAQKRLKTAYRRVEERINDPYNERSMYRESSDVLDAFVSGDDFNLGEVLVALTSLARWHGAKGVVESHSGESNRSLCTSFWFDRLYNTIMRLSFSEERDRRNGSPSNTNSPIKLDPRISFNDQGLLLARGFALGLIKEADKIGRESLIGIEDGIFYGVGFTALTPFVVQVYSKWKGIEVADREEASEEPEPYRELIRNLTGGREVIKKALIDSCDFHLSRSWENDDRETYEFADPVYAIYPVEILMFLRIRQLLDLPNPEVDHPLLRGPIGTLPANGCEMNPIHSRILARIMTYSRKPKLIAKGKWSQCPSVLESRILRYPADLPLVHMLESPVWARSL